MFLSFPYEADNEVHGFDNKVLQEYCKVDYVCRGGFFGGHKDILTDVNTEYYHLLDETLNKKCLGTEESLFTIMAGRSLEKYVRYKLQNNGLIGKFFNEIGELNKLGLSKREFRERLLKNIANPPKTNSDVSVSIYIICLNN